MEQYDRTAEILKALAHPCRLYLLDLLRSRQIQVCKMAREAGQRQPYISQHLAILRGAGLVCARREGACVYYCLADSQICDLLDLCTSLAARLEPEAESSLPAAG